MIATIYRGTVTVNMDTAIYVATISEEEFQKQIKPFEEVTVGDITYQYNVNLLQVKELNALQVLLVEK